MCINSYQTVTSHPPKSALNLRHSSLGKLFLRHQLIRIVAGHLVPRRVGSMPLQVVMDGTVSFFWGMESHHWLDVTGKFQKSLQADCNDRCWRLKQMFLSCGYNALQLLSWCPVEILASGKCTEHWIGGAIMQDWRQNTLSQCGFKVPCIVTWLCMAHVFLHSTAPKSINL